MGKGGPTLVLRVQRRNLLHDLEMGISISFPPPATIIWRGKGKGSVRVNVPPGQRTHPVYSSLVSMLDQAAEGLENPELAEDALADLFFALYVHDNSIDPTQLAATWLKDPKTPKPQH